MKGRSPLLKYRTESLLGVLQAGLRFLENPQDKFLWHKFYFLLEHLERDEAYQRLWERLIPGLKGYDPEVWKLALDVLFHDTVVYRLTHLQLKAMLANREQQARTEVEQRAFTEIEQQTITDDISLAAVARITEFSGESVEDLFVWLQHIADEYFELYSTSAKTDLSIKQAQTFDAVCHLVFDALKENKQITLQLLRKFSPYERFLLRRWRKGKQEPLSEPNRYPVLALVLLKLKKGVEAA